MSKRRSSGSKSRGVQSRRVNVRALRQRLLIVCEGEQTEPAYFKSFQIPGQVIVHAKGFGETTLKLIEQAQKEAENDTDGYDQTWCVFDRDDCTVADINSAFQQASRLGYRVAFSNQAFELWYLLHFHYFNTAMTRQQYYERLDQLLGFPYRKNHNTMYDHLLDRQQEAIRNAERLLNQYNPWQPAHCDPSTTVHWLVEELNKHRRP